jgi:hypothetical protein
VPGGVPPLASPAGGAPPSPDLAGSARAASSEPAGASEPRSGIDDADEPACSPASAESAELGGDVELGAWDGVDCELSLDDDWLGWDDGDGIVAGEDDCDAQPKAMINEAPISDPIATRPVFLRHIFASVALETDRLPTKES